MSIVEKGHINVIINFNNNSYSVYLSDNKYCLFILYC